MEKFLTVKDVANMLGVKQVTIYKYLRERKLVGTYFKIGGVYRFKEEALKAMIEELKQ